MTTTQKTKTGKWRDGWEDDATPDGRVVLCDACGDAFDKGWFCNACQTAYRKGDASSKRWIACDYCENFTHFECESGEYLQGEWYACPVCRELGDLPEPITPRAEVPRLAREEQIGERFVVSKPYEREISEPTVATALGALSKAALMPTRVMPLRTVRTTAYKEQKSEEERKSEGVSKRRPAGGRPRAPKEVFRPRAGAKPPHVTLNASTRKKIQALSDLYCRDFEPVADVTQVEPIRSINCLYPGATGPMRGPLATLGQLPKLQPDEMGRYKHKAFGKDPMPTVRKVSKSLKRTRGVIEEPIETVLKRTRKVIEKPEVPRLRATSRRTTFEEEEGKTQRTEESDQFQQIAAQIVEAVNPVFDTHTIYLNVVRLLHRLKTLTRPVTYDEIQKSNLKNIIEALLSSDDVRIRIEADSILKIPEWREIICGSATPQYVAQPYVIASPTSQPKPLALPAPEPSKSAEPPSSRPLTRGYVSRQSQSSPSVTLTPPQSMSFLFNVQDVTPLLASRDKRMVRLNS